VLASLPAHRRSAIRRLGAAGVIVGILATMLLMFFGGGYAVPIRFLPILLVAAGGVLLISIPGDRDRPRSRRVEHPVLLMLGVFFTFATIGPLMMSVFLIKGEVATPLAGLLSAAIGGVIACGWAAAFTFRRWWLIPLTILFQIFGPEPLFITADRLGLLGNFGELSEQARRGALAFESLLCVIVGYVLIVRYIRTAEREQARGRAELDMARRMHESLVPEIDFTAPGIHVFGRSTPCSEMGGDLIDVVRSADRTDLFLVDVSGHGVRAGVVMAMIKAATRMRLRSSESLEEVLADLDRVLADLIEPGMFATLACLRFEHGSASVGLAGHLPVLRVRGDTIDELSNDALPLGLGADERFSLRSAEVRPGDTLVLYTDGFTEVQGPAGRLLGLERFKQIVVKHARKPPRAAADAIIAESRAFGVTEDDQTIAIVRVTG